MKKDSTKLFIVEIYSKLPLRNYRSSKIIYNQIDGIWSIDLAAFSDYKTSNTKGYRYIFIIIDNLSKNLWAKLSKNKYSQTITQEFSKILTKSRRHLLKIESNRGPEFYNSIVQIFIKCKNFQHCSRFSDKGPSIAETVIRTVGKFLQKPIFETKADWFSELPSVNKKCNITNHSSVKMTPIQASRKSNEREVYCNLQDRRIRQQPKIK